MNSPFNHLVNSLPRRRSLRIALGTAVAILVAVFLAISTSGGREFLTKKLLREYGGVADTSQFTSVIEDASKEKFAPLQSVIDGTAITPNPPSEPVAEEPFLASIFKNVVPEVCGLSAAEAKAFIESSGSGGFKVYRSLAGATSQLVQSEKLADKTLGLYLVAHLAGEAAMESERLNYPGCKRGSTCYFDKPYEAMLAARFAGAEPLVELALSSSDANVYATALHACSGAKTGACTTLTYRHWAEMEPENAAAWLMAASEAASRQDTHARRLALQRAVAANTFNPRMPAFGQVLATKFVKALSPLEQMTTASAMVSWNAAVNIGSMSGITSHCGRSRQRDDATHATCDSLVSKLAEQDESLIGLLIANTIGETIGLPANRMQPLKDEYAVVKGQMYEGMILDERMFTCEALIKSNQLTEKTFGVGERTRARELIQKSGKNLAELAESYRTAMPGYVK